MRKQVAAANWKMNTTYKEATQLMDEINRNLPNVLPHQHVIIAPPFPYLSLVKSYTDNLGNIYTSAQNCHQKASGAYTGEVSAEMLQSISIPYVILGHSERREYFNESNALIAEKINMALNCSIYPIFCCGESLIIRKLGTQNDFVTQQLTENLGHLNETQILNLIIAYEPIWAIGTGETATAEQAQEMHAHIRKWIAKKFNADISNNMSILYGGSVKASNAKELFSQPDVDGGLVGGASLKAEEFISIVKALK